MFQVHSRHKGLGSKQVHLLLAPKLQQCPCVRLAAGPSCFRKETRRAGCPFRRLFPKPARPVVTSQPGPRPVPRRRFHGPGLLALPFLQYMDQGLRLGSCLDLLAAQGNLVGSKASPLQLPLSCSVKSIDSLKNSMLFYVPVYNSWLPHGSEIKTLPAMQETQV